MVLICISLILSDPEHLFTHLLALWMSSLKKCLGLLHIFLIRFVFVTELYELTVYLDIDPFVSHIISNIFSLSVDCIFTLLIISFAVQKLSSSIMSHLFTLAFTPIGLGYE